MLKFIRCVFRRGACVAMLMVSLTSPLHAQVLTVLADSSLAEALKALTRQFEAGRKGTSVTLQSGAPGLLLQQISQGLPADVLISTGEETAALGVQRHLLVSDLRSGFASNKLVLVVPASRSVTVQRLSDLARPEVVRFAMGREVSVPAGRFAREVINAQRLWPALQRKAVLGDDLRDVLAWVAGGDVDAGFVFATDAAALSGRVRIVETLDTAAPIRHLANVTSGSRNPALAQAFIDHLRSEPAREVLKQLGFSMP